jgi:hypothetical protein
MRLFGRIFAAAAGRKLWLKIRRDYSVGTRAVLILMPENDDELNGTALRYIDELLVDRKAERAVIMTVHARACIAAAKLPDGIVIVPHCKSRDIGNILSFYELYRFADAIIVVSMTKPYGIMFDRALGFCGITLGEIVYFCIFGIRNRKPDSTAAENGDVKA